MDRYWRASRWSFGLVLLVTMAPSPTPRNAPGPSEALALMADTPFDADRAIEIESPENTAAGGERYISRVTYQRVQGQDVWRLRQRAGNGPWLDYALTVSHGRVYFAQLGQEPTLQGLGCAACHANGPRALLGTLREGTSAEVRAFNRRVARQRVVRPYYPPGDLPDDLEPLDAPACTRCHDGRHRSVLTRENSRAVAFRVDAGTMPPARPLADHDREAIEAWLSDEDGGH